MRNSFVFLFSFFVTTIAIGSEGEKFKWKAPEYPGLSFEYPACVETSTSQNLDYSVAYVFNNKGKCPKSDLGNWGLQIGRLKIGDKVVGARPPEVLETKIKIKGISMTSAEKVKPDVFEPWSVQFDCNGKTVYVAYHRDLALPATDWHHKMPAPLKEFLETVRCEK